MWCHTHQQNQGEGWPGAAAQGLAGHCPAGEQWFSFVSLIFLGFYFSLCVIFPFITYFFVLRDGFDHDCSDGVWHGKLDPHCLLPETGEMKHHSLRGPVTLKDRQLCFVLPIVNFIPSGVRMTFNFFEIKICANMVKNLHVQCDICFNIHSKYGRILMYWSVHFHLII